MIEALGHASTNSDVEVREIAVTALGQKRPDVRSVVPLLEQALADPELSVRLKAALAIRAVTPESRSYVPVLVESLRAGHGTVFLEVGNMGADAQWAIPTLVAALSDRRAPIRALAAQTLGEIGVADDRVETSLRRGLRDEQLAVRKACERALDRLDESPQEAQN